MAMLSLQCQFAEENNKNHIENFEFYDVLYISVMNTNKLAGNLLDVIR